MCAAKQPTPQKMPTNEKIQKFFNRVFDRKGSSERAARSTTREVKQSSASGNKIENASQPNRVARAWSIGTRGFRRRQGSSERREQKHEGIEKSNMKKLQQQALKLQEDNLALQHHNDELQCLVNAANYRAKYLKVKLHQARRSLSLPPTTDGSRDDLQRRPLAQPDAAPERESPELEAKPSSQTGVSDSDDAALQAEEESTGSAAPTGSQTSANQMPTVQTTSMQQQVRLAMERQAAATTESESTATAATPSETDTASVPSAHEKEEQELPEKVIKTRDSIVSAVACLYPQRELEQLSRETLESEKAATARPSAEQAAIERVTASETGVEL